MCKFEVKGFITDLEVYNAGELKGEWVAFPLTDEEVEELDQKYSKHEYFWTDWDISGLNIDWQTFGEYISINEVNDLINQIEELDDGDFEKLNAILECESLDINDALDSMDSYDFYEGETLEDLAYEFVEDQMGGVPELFTQYFDYAAFARDLSFDGYTETSNGVLVG